jgi:hypothetical protein
MNKTMKRRDESGQILIVLTVGIVALLGILALAVDGGMIYADRRYDQNAADSSALAGAGILAMSLENQGVIQSNFSCDDNRVLDAIEAAKLAAKNRAASNNFTIDLDVANQHGVEVYCHNPAGPFDPRYLDVYTMVSSELQTSFAHLFYKGPVRNVVEATVRVNTGGDGGFGYALATLSPVCSQQESLWFTGGKGNEESSVYLINAGAHSNGCIWRNGKITVISEEDVTYFTNYTDNGTAGTVTPDPEPLGYRIPRPNFDDVMLDACNHLDDKGDISKPKEDKPYSPGKYGTISVGNNDYLKLEPGLYCISGTVKITGGDVEGNGVTIVMLKNGISITGGTLKLSAPTADNLSYRNLLLYALTTNTTAQQLTGNSESIFIGSILVPNGAVTIGGTTGNNKDGAPTYTTQVVADSIKVHGAATLNLNYDESMVWKMPSLVSLVK